MKNDKPRVRISNPEHPHYGAVGRFTGEVIKLFGKPMARIELENWSLGDDCYVSQGDITPLEDKP